MKKLLWLLAFLCFASSAQAQFADQRQYAPSSGGTANAQTVAVSNYALNVGVVIRFKASNTNTGAMTLNVNGTGVKALDKQTTSGLTALTGNEVYAGQIVQVIYDGTLYELIQ